MQEIPKYINHQGKVAVIITNIPRAGWYTEHKIKEAVFDPDIVNAILMDEDSGVIEQIAVKKYGRVYTLFTILHYKETNEIKKQLLKKKLQNVQL